LVTGLDFEHNWLNRKYFISTKGFYSNINGSENSIARLQRSSRHLFQREDAGHLEYDPELTVLQGWGGEMSGGKRSGKFRAIGTFDWRSPGVDLNDMGYLRQADYINQELLLQYNVNKPKGILLRYSLQFEQKHNWSFGGENLKDGLDLQGRLTFKNYWNFTGQLNHTFNEFDTRQLRGGPSLRIDTRNTAGAILQTNSSKNLVLAAKTYFSRYDDNISWKNQYDFSVRWLISNNFSVSSITGYSEEKDNSQYVKQKVVDGKREYVVGLIDRKTLYTTLRVEYFITPELSLQYYGSPYASVGKYTSYRKVDQAKAKNLEERFAPLFTVSDDSGDYLVDENGNEILDFNYENPDFDFNEFRSNFVLRWEYKTGSTLYFVWTNTSTTYTDIYNPSVAGSLFDFKNSSSQNAFMIKFSYWFSL
jgi:hypothetical protein